MKEPIARLAPTPSGFLHHGNAANFLLNARLASPNGRLYLRIDDLDRARFREEYLEDIFRVIDQLGIPVTDGPANPTDFHANWSQAHRMSHYHQALDQLRTSPKIYACDCSRRTFGGERHTRVCKAGKLSLDTPDVAWRHHTTYLSLHVPDLVRESPFLVDLHREMGDFVVRKKDGTPSYQLACVVDDFLFGINRVGRGQDLLASTAAQALLSDLLEYPPLYERIEFIHHPLLVAVDGEKLSKSAGAESVSGLGAAFDRAELLRTVDGWLAKNR